MWTSAFLLLEFVTPMPIVKILMDPILVPATLDSLEMGKYAPVRR